MSKENVRLFYGELAKNDRLKAEFKEVNGSFDQNTSEDKLDEVLEGKIIPIAKKAGFEFTLSELKEFARESLNAGELSNDELDAVAGGSTCACAIFGYANGDDGACGCGLAGGGTAPKDKQDYCSCFLAGYGGD